MIEEVKDEPKATAETETTRPADYLAPTEVREIVYMQPIHVVETTPPALAYWQAFSWRMLGVCTFLLALYLWQQIRAGGAKE
jgi:hypothetical protein